MQSIASHTIHLLLSTCLLEALLSPITLAQPPPYSVCLTNYNYTQGSQYQSNLNLTLTTLASNITPDGFYITSLGTNPDDVYGLLQCRGDISYQDCQACAKSISVDILQRCPYQKEAVIFDDKCMLHYADYRFFSQESTTPSISLYNFFNASNPTLFNSQSKNLMENLSAKASSGRSKFATGVTTYGDFGNIYGLVQCTRDLPNDSCSKCLQSMITYIPTCCDGKQGGRVLATSCYIRYETYSFFESSPSSAPTPSVVGSPPPTTVVEDDSPTGTTTTTTTTNPDGGQKKTNQTNMILEIVIPVVISSMLTSAICVFLLWRRLARRKVEAEDGITSTESLVFDLNTLRTATNNFSDSYKLGQGGFGPVYKGKLPDGRVIAVKRLSRKSGQGLEEMKTEVLLVAKLLHRNLVRLLGFCLEEEEKLLVYEFLPNGSLDKILFDRSKCLLLGWDKRYKIITGIARGLLYLHQDSQIRIIHRDMKASNILLDEDMNAKISDFGLARLVESQAQGNTNRIAGTFGYMAPEYTRHGHFSTKSDVFSFGVLVLEIVAGRKNSSFRDPVNLLSYTWQLWSDGLASEMVDPALGDQWPRTEVMKCIQLGLLCVQEHASDRPTMSEVVLLLSTYSVTCRVPSQPAYFVRRMRTGSNESKDSSIAIEPVVTISQQSVNEVTITDLDPR